MGLSESPELIFSAVGAVAGATSAVISILIFFLAKSQLARAIDEIRARTYQQLYETMIAIDRFFIDNPDMKPYFYPGQGGPADADVDRRKLLSVAEMMTDYFDNVYHQQDVMPRGTFSGFRSYMRQVHDHSTALRDYLYEQNGSRWYSKEFLEALSGGDVDAPPESGQNGQPG